MDPVGMSSGSSVVAACAIGILPGTGRAGVRPYRIPFPSYAASTPRFAVRTFSTAATKIPAAAETSSSVLNRPNEKRRLARARSVEKPMARST